jgi:ligand-binding sensor domain-containing protein
LKVDSHIVRWIILLLLYVGRAEGQHFDRLNTDFPMGPSEELFQDAAGFLWIGTTYGLVRFDGYSTITYTHDPENPESLAGNNINAIHEDSSGRVWVGLSLYGLDVFDPDTRAFRRVGLDGDVKTRLSVHGLCPDLRGDMWVAADDGLYRLSADPAPRVLASYHHEKTNTESLSGLRALAVHADSRGRVWVGTERGLNRLDPASGRFVNTATDPSYPGTQILDIAEDREGGIWVCARFSEHRLYRLDESTGHFLPVSRFRGAQYGDFRITFDPDNVMWISARGAGLFRYDHGRDAVTFFDPTAPGLHGYRNLYGLRPRVDRYGNLWIAGEQLHVLRATGKAFQRIDTDDQPVTAVHGHGRFIWYGTSEPMRYDRVNDTNTPFWPPGLPHESDRWRTEATARRRLQNIQSLDDQRLLMASTRNVFVWHPDNDTYREYSLDYGGPFRALVVSEDTREVWICGNQGSPIRLDLQSGRADRPMAVAEIRDPQCGLRAPDGAIWFGTATGVYRFDPGDESVTRYAPDEPDPGCRLSDFFVTDITHTADAIWAATGLGVNRIDLHGGGITRIRKQGVFANENVVALEADARGRLWLATPQGLVRHDPSDGSFRRYGRADGLINATYTRGAASRDSSGTLYFGGDQGIDFFDPDQVGTNDIPPDLLLGGIRVNGQSIDTLVAAHHLRHLDLGPDARFVELELLGVHLTAPSAHQYAYRIPEIDTLWRELGDQRTFALANLSPGAYTIQARAANADGFWSPVYEVVTIRIRPPFWRTGWFATLIFLLLTGLLVSAYRYRIGQVRRQAAMRGEFNRRLAELESTALRAQMNPHFLFNSLNSVKSLIAQGESAKATLYLTRFGQLIRQVLANSEKQTVRLQEELDALRLYLEIEQLRFQNFIWQIEVGPEVDADFLEVPPLILQPYVENAIWHGLMHKETGERLLRVDVRHEGDVLRMTVTDNGIGRAQARQLHMRSGGRKGGMGMRLTGDRLQLLREVYGREVTVAVTDLYAGDKPAGTRVDIGIPWPE